MIYLSSTPSKAIFYDICQLIKQCLNDLNDNFNGNTSENDKKYQSDGHMYCVAIDSILMLIMSIIDNNTRTNCLVCQQIINQYACSLSNKINNKRRAYINQ